LYQFQTYKHLKIAEEFALGVLQHPAKCQMKIKQKILSKFSNFLLDFLHSFQWCTPKMLLSKGKVQKLKYIIFLRLAKIIFFTQTFSPPDQQCIILVGILVNWCP